MSFKAAFVKLAGVMYVSPMRKEKMQRATVTILLSHDGNLSQMTVMTQPIEPRALPTPRVHNIRKKMAAKS